MILIDANLLLYAKIDTYDHHVAARTWFNDQINGSAPVGLSWTSLLAFLRVSTNPRAHANPLSVHAACTQVEAWLGLEAVWIPSPGDRHPSILLTLLRAVGAKGNLVTDAHLAALAIEHGLTLCSADTDFVRFPGLRWVNPLAP